MSKDNPREHQNPPGSDDLFRFMVESVNDYAIFATDKEGRVTSWNTGAERIFGYQDREIIGHNSSILFVPDDVESGAPEKELEQAAAEGRAEDERWHLRKDGTTFWASGTVTPLRDSSGGLRGFVKVARDRTELRLAEERRARRAALRADISAVFSFGEGAATLGQTLQRCAEAIVEHLHAAFARVWTLNAEESVLELRASAGIYTHTDGPHSRVAVGQLKIGLIAQERRPHLTNDVQHDPRVGDKEWARREGMVAFAGYPLLAEDRLVGVMAMFARQPLPEETLDALSSIADTIAQGIERKRAEEAMRTQAALIDLSPDAIIVRDMNNRVTFWSKGAEALYGWNAEDVKGRSTHELFQTRFPEPLERIEAKLYQTGRWAGELTHTARDGREVVVESRWLLRHDGQEECQAVLESNVDITERKRAEEARFRLAAIVESSDDAIISKDLAGLITSWNSGAASLFGYTEAEVIGQPITIIIPPELHEEERNILHRLRAGERIEHFETVRVDKQGRPIDVSLTVSPIRDKEGRVVGASKIARDITEHRRAEEERARLLESEHEARRQAEEANRTKDEFLAMLSHELRTPLTAILGWSRMLSSGQLGTENLAPALESIERNARAQARLIDDILDVSRIITGKLHLDVRPVDLAPIVEGAVESVRPAAEAKGIRLQRVLDTGPQVVSGDPERLQQVVWNLLSNAVKFTPKGGRVQVRLERVNSHVEIVVSDTGVGINPEVLPHVFERFRQADSSTTRKHGGLGLGLAIVRHLVELHGGTVRVESEGEGRGATFTVDLPLMIVRLRRPRDTHEDAHPKIAADESLVCPPELDGLHVLVVDDEEDARALLNAILTNCGAQVRAVGTAREALEHIGREKYDVLLSDIGMSHEDGYWLIKKVRKLPPERGGRTPAAALTAYARPADRMRALRSGYQQHVPKPVDPAELVAVVANLAGRHDED